MDEKTLCERYPDIPQLLLPFAMAAYDDVYDDRRVIYGDWFDKSYSRGRFERFRQQAAEILSLPEFPWDPVSSIANRYFPDEQSCREWFVRVLALMKERVAAGIEDWSPDQAGSS